MNILMAGKSAVKAKGIKLAFSKLFPEEVVTVTESTAPSLVNEQPIGYEEGRQGARNRLNAADNYAEEHNINYAYIVAVESYLTLGSSNLLNKDCAVILVCDVCGNITEITTESLEFTIPEGLSLDYNPQTNTLGKVLSEVLGFDDKDPHLYFTNGEKSRSEFIAEAIINSMSI